MCKLIATTNNYDILFHSYKKVVYALTYIVYVVKKILRISSHLFSLS